MSISKIQDAGVSLTGAALPAGSVTPDLLAQPLTSGTAVATTSGTAIDFTGIPSWAQRVTVMIAGVRETGTVPITFRLGTSSGVVATGYVGVQGYVGGGPAATHMSTGFEFYNDTASVTFSGAFVLTLQDLSTNTWCVSGVVGAVGGSPYSRLMGGYIPLGGTLTQVRMTTTTGTPTFNAGSINIMYE